MASIADISEYLEGLNFPATKREIIDYADDRSAPEEVLDALDLMPEPADGFYFSMTNVWDAVGALTWNTCLGLACYGYAGAFLFAWLISLRSFLQMFDAMRSLHHQSRNDRSFCHAACIEGYWHGISGIFVSARLPSRRR